MRDPFRTSSVELLEPRTAADRRILYELVLEALVLAGAPTDAVRRLSLATVRHLSGHGGRVLLSGEDSRGKIRLVRTLVAALDLPFIEIDAAMLAETNWRGADLAFYLERLLAQLEQRYARASVPRIAERACILVTNLERVRLPGIYSGSSSTRDYREGKALSLCPLFDEGTIPIAKDSGGGLLWPSRQAFVIATASFDGLSTEARPDAEALELWGIARPLADALSAFTWIRIEPSNQPASERSVRAELQPLVEHFLAFGYHLRVTDQVVRYLLDLVNSGTDCGAVRRVAAIVAGSADRALARLLEDRAPPGAVYTLARDDLDRSLGMPPTGPWRD